MYVSLIHTQQHQHYFSHTHALNALLNSHRVDVHVKCINVLMYACMYVCIIIKLNVRYVTAPAPKHTESRDLTWSKVRGQRSQRDPFGSRVVCAPTLKCTIIRARVEGTSRPPYCIIIMHLTHLLVSHTAGTVTLVARVVSAPHSV